MQSDRYITSKNRGIVDKEQCSHYDNDMRICLAGFGKCGTKGKYSYSAKCGTAMYLSIEKCLKDSGHL